MHTPVNTQKPFSPDVDAKPWGVMTLAALAALLLFRLLALGLDSSGLMFDEAQYWLWGKEPAFGYFSKPPLLAWIIALFTAVCGSDSEFCVRLPSAITHTATASLIYFVAKGLFDRRTGFWAAIIFATLPGISYSAFFITTDVPLLFCWAGALLFFQRMLDQPRWNYAIVLGLFLGFGLLAKYAMAYFVLSVIIYAMVDKDARKTIFGMKLLVALAISVALISPNIWWNSQNGFITASHTGTNIGWRLDSLHPVRALEFIASQLAVFGPIPFVILLLAVIHAVRKGIDDRQKFLLAFSLPVLALMTFQGLMSKAYANWAAVSYIAATVLIADIVVNRAPPFWKRLSLSVHLGVIVALSAIMMFSSAGQAPEISKMKFIKRIQGWREIAQIASTYLDAHEYSAIIAPRRHLTAELVYYLRHRKEKVFALQLDKVPRDHYELTRNYQGTPQGDILLVSTSKNIPGLLKRFDQATLLGTERIASGRNPQIWFYRLQGYRNPAAKPNP